MDSTPKFHAIMWARRRGRGFCAVVECDTERDRDNTGLQGDVLIDGELFESNGTFQRGLFNQGRESAFWCVKRIPHEHRPMVVLCLRSCIDTQPAFRLIHEVDDGDFPERAAYARALLMRTVADLRSTADFLEKRLTGQLEYDDEDADKSDGIKERILAAVQRERSATVKWLRNHDDALADRIERMEHVSRKKR